MRPGDRKGRVYQVPLSYELLEGSGMAEPSRDHLVQLLLFVYNNRFLVPEADSEQRRRATRARV